MNTANLRDENGFVTQLDLALRLSRFEPPPGEAFFLRRIPGRLFSRIGVTFRSEELVFFSIYTGDREVYLSLKPPENPYQF